MSFHILPRLSKTLVAWHGRTPKRRSQNNLQVLCEHLHLPKARQVEFKARIIAMAFAVNSACWATFAETSGETYGTNIQKPYSFETNYDFRGSRGLPEGFAAILGVGPKKPFKGHFS